MWWDVILEALIDTAKLFPLLLLVHILIEIFEHLAASKIRFSRALKGPLAPLIGAGVGVIPQCGFSVVAADLYSKKSIGLGALLAVFIATSDEAVPILLSQPGSIGKLLVLIGIKVIFALIVGYTAHFLFRKREYTAPEKTEDAALPEVGCHGHKICQQSENDRKLGWRDYFLHPLLHSLTISAYILIVNLIFGYLIFFIGEANLSDFMSMTAIFQPFLAALIGLVPNCAASVAITQLYAVGGLGIGAAVAGLSVNAGLGFAVLFKENKNFKENILILVGLYLLSALVGMGIELLSKYVFFF